MTDEFLRRWSRKKSESNRIFKRKSDIKRGGSDQVKIRDANSHLETLGDLVEEPEKSNVPDLETEPIGSESESSTETQSDTESEKKKVSDFDDIDFDALSFDSDYTQFMNEGVPEVIQRKALRKLWASNPILANIDGLNDYDEDFTDAALAVDVIKTAYKVGSGYLTEEEQEQQEKLGSVEETDSSSEGETEPVSEIVENSDSTEDQHCQDDSENIAISEKSENGNKLKPDPPVPNKNKTA